MSGLLDTLHRKFVFGRRVATLAKRLGDMIPAGARILDVGCGDGQISAQIAGRLEGASVTGIDVFLRPVNHIPVVQFDGTTIPFDDSTFDVVMFVDVLHHTEDPRVLLAEAARVTKKYVLLKDHFRTGVLSGATLRLMDWVGNAHHGVALPYNYLSPSEWERIYQAVALRPLQVDPTLRLYPQPADWIFGRNLHFVALLEKR